MTTLIDLKTKLNEARKAKDARLVSTLSTLVGELQTKAKNTSGSVDVLATIKSFRDNLKQLIKAKLDAGTDVEDYQDEKWELEFYNSFLPQQLSESETRTLVSNLIENGASNIGQVMAGLRDYNNVDKRLASQIAKEALNG